VERSRHHVIVVVVLIVRLRQRRPRHGPTLFRRRHIRIQHEVAHVCGRPNLPCA
jgi:hypothetical protein